MVAIRGRVITPLGLGHAVVLDLDQDNGYGIGVRLDSLNGEVSARREFVASDVRTFAEYADQLTQLMHATHDGNIIGKSQRTQLVALGLATHVNGFSMITPAGIQELIKQGYIDNEGYLISKR